MKSWDSFAVPRPFSRVRCLFGEPLVVPPGLSPEGLEPHCGRLQKELDRLTTAAQTWADRDRLELPPTISQTRVVQQPSRIAETAGVVRGGRE
jgi:hypothetical protein